MTSFTLSMSSLPYTLSFTATAQKLKTENSFVLRVNDKTNSVIATPQVPGNPPIDSPVEISVEIIDSGQTKLLSN